MQKGYPAYSSMPSYPRIKLHEKKTTRYEEQDPQKAAAYQEQLKDVPPEKIAYVDECGIDTYLYREYGYAPRGQQVLGRVSDRKYIVHFNRGIVWEKSPVSGELQPGNRG